MASNIFFNGQRTYRPGVYLRVIDAITAPTSLSAGNIAVIGHFPVLQQAKIHTFSQPQSMRDYCFPEGVGGESLRDDTLRELQYVSSIAWDNLMVNLGDGQQIDSISLINVTDVTPASLTSAGLLIESKFYGAIGNQLKVKLELDNGGADGLSKLTVKRGETILEEFDDIGDLDPTVIKFTNDGTEDLVGATVEVTASTLTDTDGDGVVGSDNDYRSGGQLIVRGVAQIANADIVALSGGGDLWTVPNINMGGAVVKVKCLSALTSSHTLTVHGTAPNGTALTEDLDFVNGDGANTEVTTTAVFYTVSKVSIDTGAGFTGDLQIDFPIFGRDLIDIPSMGDVVSELIALDPRFSASDAPAIPVAGMELDALAQSSCLGANLLLDTRLYRIWERALNASQFLRTKLVSNALPSAGFDTYLSGGAVADDADSTDWEDALASLLYENINIVVPFSNDIAIHRLVKEHTRLAAVESGLERNAWVGTPANTSLQNTHLQYVKELNDKNMAVVCQGVRLKAPGVGTIILDNPYWLALGMAVLQAGTPIAEPLTRKPLSNNVDTLLNGSLPDPNASANDAIRKGIVIVNRQRPYRVERSVTTYLKNPSHPVFTEVSANEGINVSARDVRAFVDTVIGSKATADKLAQVQSLVVDRLSIQRDRGIISGFRDVAVELVGDTINVSYYVAAQEPLNFVLVNAYLSR